MKYLDIIQTLFFAFSVLSIRYSVISIIEGGKYTHSMWKALNKANIKDRFTFICQSVKTTFFKGKPITGDFYGDFSNESNLVKKLNLLVKELHMSLTAFWLVQKLVLGQH
jgi:hypothetical protein